MEIPRSTVFWLVAAAGIGGVLWWMNRAERKEKLAKDPYYNMPWLRPHTAPQTAPAPGMKWVDRGAYGAGTPEDWVQMPINPTTQGSGNSTIDVITDALKPSR